MDFVVEFDFVNIDLWEGLVLLFYWEKNFFNFYVLWGDMVGLIKVINGGYNGLKDWFGFYSDIVFVLFGYEWD